MEQKEGPAGEKRREKREEGFPPLRPGGKGGRMALRTAGGAHTFYLCGWEHF